MFVVEFLLLTILKLKKKTHKSCVRVVFCFFFSEFSPERHGSNTSFGKADCVVEMLTLRNHNTMCFLMCKSLFCANSSIQGAQQGLSQVKGINFCGNCLSKYWQPLTKASSLNIATFEITSVCEKDPELCKPSLVKLQHSVEIFLKYI